MAVEIQDRVARILRRNRFQVEDILYLTHEGQRTVFHLQDKREIPTPIPLKTVVSCIPAGDFWSIQKGIVVARRYVISIDGKGLYTMSDGMQFTGRGRNPAEHKRRAEQLRVLPARSIDKDKSLPFGLLDRCKLMDNAPIAFCAIELVFAQDGRGVDFVFRYCNRAMEPVEGLTVEQMVDRSFYEVFPKGDRKWIVPYADVAMNGTTRILNDYSSEVQKNLRISCFQPEPGYCACMIVAVDG